MRILVVDDSKSQRFLLVQYLKELGYADIVEAGSAEEARNYLQEERVDLVFSDWHMTGENGLGLLKYVRANPLTSKVLFVMITTEHERKNILEAARNGLNSYVFKPIDKKVIAEKLLELYKSYGIQPPNSTPT